MRCSQIATWWFFLLDLLVLPCCPGSHRPDWHKHASVASPDLDFILVSLSVSLRFQLRARDQSPSAQTASIYFVQTGLQSVFTLHYSQGKHKRQWTCGNFEVFWTFCKSPRKIRDYPMWEILILRKWQSGSLDSSPDMFIPGGEEKKKAGDGIGTLPAVRGEVWTRWGLMPRLEFRALPWRRASASGSCMRATLTGSKSEWKKSNNSNIKTCWCEWDWDEKKTFSDPRV